MARRVLIGSCGGALIHYGAGGRSGLTARHLPGDAGGITRHLHSPSGISRRRAGWW